MVQGASTYVAGAGETLEGVAQALGVDPAALADANPHLADAPVLPQGVHLAVPAADVSVDARAADAASPPGSTPSSLGVAVDAGGPANTSGRDVGPSAQGVATSASPLSRAAPATPSIAASPSAAQPGASALAASPGARAADSSTTGSVSFTAAQGSPLAAVLDPTVVAQAAAERPVPSSLESIFAQALSLGGRLPPELQTAAPLVLAAALARIDWTPVAAAQVRPGDVVIVAMADGLHAVRVSVDGEVLGADGAALELQSGPASEPAEAPAALRPADPMPPGVDLPARPPTRASQPVAARARSRAAGRGASTATQDPRRRWIERVLPAAKWVKARWGAPVSVVTAHGALVSDWGRLAPGNDYFGLLSSVAPGANATPVRNLPAPVVEGYASLDDAADAFGAFLGGDRRIARALTAGRAPLLRTLEEVAFREPRYAARMEALIELNNLSALDAA